MKDKVLTYAIAASVAAHLIAVGVVGRTSASRLNAAPVAASAERLINVDLVKEPAEATKEKLKPVDRPTPEPEATPRPLLEEQTPRAATMPPPTQTMRPVSRPAAFTPSKPHGFGNRLPGNPGGKLNIGSTSAHGDLGGNWGGGRTPTGWVPGSDDGKGRGSGSGAGEGRPEPVKNASEGPGMAPAPEPKTVSVKVCDESGLLAGEYCKSTGNKSFIDGDEPRRVCNRCKAPEHKSRLADQANPTLIKDASVSVPSSVEEGLSVTVKVEYTVTEEGSVRDVDVIQSSGNRTLDKAVVSTTSRLKYKPAVQDGVARSVKMTRTYRVNT
ncbi:MAG: energy transducer TonB [Armatimonadota bacterium]